MAEERQKAILLPGIVLPAAEAYPALLDALGPDVEGIAKELEVYAEAEPPPGYRLEAEVEGIRRTADAAGFERFHLVGYSAGGAISLVFAAAHADRLLSLALLEPAWAGNRGSSAAEKDFWRRLEEIVPLPPEEAMPRFMRIQLAPGVEPPPPPPGPPPPWMAKRPAGLRAFDRAVRSAELDLERLRRLHAPVYFALGGLSNPDYYARMAQRLSDLFDDFSLERFEDRHHFDPPHRIEPDRLAASLASLWARAEAR